jgi:asparagine synthase (glutamine-hydrolysing)
MPGIVGLITGLPRERAEAELLQMVQAMCHEDFYAAGMWADESLGVYVGWVARKGSFCDGMPLRNEKGDLVLVFSGEEFPKPGVAQRLKERGHQLEIEGPSYLVHLCEEDPSFPAGLNGGFHGLLTDRRRGTSVLFNDRYGMHRVYYHESKDAFYFAAEAKAILAVCPELRRMDLKGFGEFVSCGAVLENRSLFEGIHLLPQASTWVFRNKSLEGKCSYFHPREWEDQEALDSEFYYQKLRQVFSQNLPRYFNSSERVAVSLTGGLDTRMIMAWHKPEAGSLPCYTFAGTRRDCRDVIVARQVARICRQPHQEIRVGNEFLSRFSHYAERAVYLSDGCADLSRAPDLYLNQRARKIAPVRMTGVYGGEVLRRVRAFKAEEPVAGVFSPDFLRHVHQAGETYASLLRGHPVTFAVFRQTPWYHCGILSLEATQLSMRSPFLDNDLVRTVFRSPQSALAASDVSFRLIGDGNGALVEVPTDRGLAGGRTKFLGPARHALLEFLFKAEYAYDVGMPQWVARVDYALSPLRLERLFLGRHKIFHFRTWYRDALAGYVRAMLLDPRSLSRPYIERRRLEAIVRDHLKGVRNYTTEIHKVLSLELLHRIFLENPEKCSSGVGVAAAVGAPPNGGRCEALQYK